MADAVNDGGAADSPLQPTSMLTDAVLLIQTAAAAEPPVVDSASTAVATATATTPEGVDVDMAPAAHSPAEAPVEPSPTTLQERRKQVESVRAPEASADALEPKATLETTKNWVEAIPTILHSFQKKESDLIDALAIPRCAPCQRRRDGGLQRLADQKCLEKNCILRGVPVCSKCFDTFHTTPEQLQHPQTVCSSCPQCQLERVVYYCAECDLSFCTACFDAIHSIPKVQHHRKFAMEGARGSLLKKANWSKNFQTTITEMIAANAAGASAKTLDPSANDASVAAQATTDEPGDQSGVGEKRKREMSNVEVILLDSDSEDDGNNRHNRQTGLAADAGNGNGFIDRDRILRAQLSAMEQSQIGARSNQGGWPGQRSAYPQATPDAHPTTDRSSLVAANPNVIPQQNQFQQPLTMAIEPISTPAPNVSSQTALSNSMQQFGIQQVVSSNAYDTINTSAGSVNESNGVSPVVVQQPTQMPYAPPTRPPTPVGMQANGAYVGAPNVPIGNGTNGSVAGNSSPQVPQIPVSGVPAPTTGYSTTLTSATPPPTDWSANPLEGVFYDRYQEVNVYTIKLEKSVTTLNAHIVQLSTQNLQAAQQSMMTLKQQQKMLQVAQTNRTAALVALILQSSSIMREVKRLRMDSLSDIPQVATASHRKCMELSEQINITNTNAATLQQQMAITLETASLMSPNAFHQSVLQINQALQVTMQSIRRWKEDREKEIVRIVQYTAMVREELKRAFHHITAAPTSQYPHQNQLNPNGYVR